MSPVSYKTPTERSLHSGGAGAPDSAMIQQEMYKLERVKAKQ